jgi:hypothetical protein
MTHWILSEFSYSHEIDVPIEQVDIADWLAHIRNAERAEAQRPIHPARLGAAGGCSARVYTLWDTL